MTLSKLLNFSELHFPYLQSEKANSKRAFVYMLVCVGKKTGCTHETAHPGCARTVDVELGWTVDVELGWTGRESMQGGDCELAPCAPLFY